MVSFTYTPTGQRATMTDASGQTTYGYDNRNRLVSKATPEGTLTYSYDAAGDVKTIQPSNQAARISLTRTIRSIVWAQSPTSMVQPSTATTTWGICRA